MMYLQAMMFLSLILRADGKGASLCVVGVHAVHADMNGHGRVYATIGNRSCVPNTFSTKSKIDTIS